MEYKKKIKKAKQDFWMDKFKTVQDSREMWKLINVKMGRTIKHSSIKKLTVRGTTIENEAEIANEQNRFFASVGVGTAASIPPTDFDPLKNVRVTEKQFEKFDTPTQEDIESIIK